MTTTVTSYTTLGAGRAVCRAARRAGRHGFSDGERLSLTWPAGQAQPQEVGVVVIVRRPPCHPSCSWGPDEIG